jgi:hypothetical protein
VFLYSDSLGAIHERYLQSGELTGRSIETGGMILAFVPSTKVGKDTYYACDSTRGLLLVDLSLRTVNVLTTASFDGE